MDFSPDGRAGLPDGRNRGKYGAGPEPLRTRSDSGPTV